MSTAINITGKHFNYLTAVKFHHKVGKRHFWIFKCHCGVTKVMNKSEVKVGHSTSCGCYHRRMVSKMFTTHGFTKGNKIARIYRIWLGMSTRCGNLRAINYKYYGGRGIKCLWESFEDFYNDMGNSYKVHCKRHGVRNTTLERIHNNGNYCKENCRWATYQEQSKNRYQ